VEMGAPVGVAVGDQGAELEDAPGPAPARYRPLFRSKMDDATAVIPDGVPALPWIPPTLEKRNVQIPADRVLLVGTDGFGDPLGDGEVGALFARHLATPPSPLQFSHILDFSRETFDDDRTLLALWPRDGRDAR
jgi:hypothetical protein